MSDHIITCDSLNFQAHTQTLSSEQMQHNELKYRSLVATLVRDLKPVRNEQTGNKLCVCLSKMQKYKYTKISISISVFKTGILAFDPG